MMVRGKLNRLWQQENGLMNNKPMDGSQIVGIGYFEPRLCVTMFCKRQTSIQSYFCQRTFKYVRSRPFVPQLSKVNVSSMNSK